MSAKTLTKAELASLVGDLIAAKTRVVAPQLVGFGPLEHVEYGVIRKAEELALDRGLPKKSIKEAFLPPHRDRVRWQLKRLTWSLTEPTNFPKTVILGARPCDAAGPGIVDGVMNWDYKDEFWNGRREATTIVALACEGVDKSCFCTTVGLGPDSKQGADLLLTPVSGGYPRGRADSQGRGAGEGVFEAVLGAEERGRREEVPGGSAGEGRGQPQNRPQAGAGLARNALRRSLLERDCSQVPRSCGGCASVCPVCHCFDIVDEPEALDHGARRRNWDTCQTGKFTLHGSGHNPRHDQNARFRQRVTHKFAIYPKKFEHILCTGCGRCVRTCPGGMDLLEILTDIGGLAGGAA